MSLDTCVLDQPLIRYRRRCDRAEAHASLPALLAAMQADAVGDFPALRPHQRHPWHAFLVQLAAIALHRAGRALANATAETWRADLAALTPDHPGLEPWCLVAPPGQPALLQAAEPSGDVSGWSVLRTPDELDMLITSKNHDLKGARMVRSGLDDWLFALVSLQTQDGYPGRGNFGISRMNGGSASRCGLGTVPLGGWGKRWARDVQVLLTERDKVARANSLAIDDGLALIWLAAWDGKTKLSFSALDPYYIEICRRIRLVGRVGTVLQAVATTSDGRRIDADKLNGCTGDPWMPINLESKEPKSLTITGQGFDYKRSVELAFGTQFRRPITSVVLNQDGNSGVCLLAQGVARGQSKTEGYHERRIPISRRMVGFMRSGQTDQLAKLARERIEVIEAVRKVLWSALCALLHNAQESKAPDGIADRANRFAQPFELEADARFFADLAEEVEAETPEAQKRVREAWLLSLESRAETFLQAAFDAGPRSAQRRYQAQSAALGRFQGSLRGKKSAVPELARLHAQRRAGLTQAADTSDLRSAEKADHEHA